MVIGLLLFSILFYVIVYIFYGNYLARVFGLDDKRPVPSQQLADGVDYCSAHPSVLMGHHFSSIAGAGPIVGPIAAAALFGWVPAFVWCLLGAALVGGVHDMGSLIASVRHEGKSIGEVVDRWVGRKGKRLFLCFTWFALTLVVAVFLELSAKTFAQDPAVAFAGTLYMVLAVIFGVAVYRLRIPLWVSTVTMLPFVLGSVWYGVSAEWVKQVFSLSIDQWRVILAGYVLVASVLPVWLLLQPRDYLASYMLYFALGISVLGILIGGGRFETSLPAFKSFHTEQGEQLWPMLFIMVACGAISGFHSLVASGTTAKQVRKESDVKVIGYGAMLIEGVLAVVAVITIMIVGTGERRVPVAVFSLGFGRFAEVLGIPAQVGTALGLLAINTFILTSLDTASRIARYQLQELFNMKLDRYTATIAGIVVALALIYVKTGDVPAHGRIWPVFGASNQLVAALALLGVALWVIKGLKKPATFLIVPMLFMASTTFAALLFLLQNSFDKKDYLLGVIALVLVVLAVLLYREAWRAFLSDKPSTSPAAKFGVGQTSLDLSEGK